MRRDVKPWAVPVDTEVGDKISKDADWQIM